MTDRSLPDLIAIEGIVEDTPESSPSPPVTAPIAPPRGYERWRRKSFAEGLIEAYHRLGGIDYLVQFGRDSPADFVRACSRMIPQQIRADLKTQVTIVHAIPPTLLDVHPVDIETPTARIHYINRADLPPDSGDADDEEQEE